MTEPAECYCGSISWERNVEERRYTCCSCKRPLWQPIETAPKDGTCVLVYSKGRVISAYFLHDDWLEVLHSYSFNDPTHWMPLPEPPK